MVIPADRPLRWGILGCGAIADTVARDLRLVPQQTITAAASATPGKATAFAAAHGIPVALQDYQQLVTRDDVDVVYIATTHERHYANAKLALAAGKAVLCEKPLTLNARQAQELVDLARQHDVFFMEAWWTRFFPATEALLRELADGAIGELRMVQADFGVRHAWSPQHRMVDPARAGGALLDLGVYPVSFAHLLYGQAPTQVLGIMRPTDQGVDAQSSIVLGFPQGGQALLMSAVDVRTPHQARLLGTTGSIIVEDFFHPHRYTVHPAEGTPRQVDLPFQGSGYQFEIAEVDACMRAGRRESLRRPLAHTLAVMHTMDTLRHAWGLRYPDEA